MAITLDGSTNNIAIGANATGPSYLRLYEDTDNGTHYIDIIAPATVTSNRTLTLPDTTGTILNDQSNIETQVKTATNSSGSAPVYAARAWVNFNGTGVIAIRGSGNVSSITDNNTGDYTVNFSTSMPDSNYSVVALGNTGSNNGYITLISTASGSCNITTRTSAAIGPDGTIICAAVFR